MPDEKTLQVILSLQEAAGVKALADQLGISVSAYLRRLILARSVPLVGAWWVREFEPNDGKLSSKYRMMQSHGLSLMRGSAEMMLELIPDHRDEYLVFDTYGRPVTEAMYSGIGMTAMFQSQGRSCLMLAGSQALWFIDRSIANSRAGGHLRWRLERWEQPND